MDLFNDAQSQTSTVQCFHKTSVLNVERIVRERREKGPWQIYQCQAEKRNLEEVLEILDGMDKMAALEGPRKQHTLSSVASIKSRVSQAVDFLDGVTRTLQRPPLVFITRKRESLDSILQTLQSDCQAQQPADMPTGVCKPFPKPPSRVNGELDTFRENVPSLRHKLSILDHTLLAAGTPGHARSQDLALISSCRSDLISSRLSECAGHVGSGPRRTVIAPTGQGASVLHAARPVISARSPTGLQHFCTGSMTQAVPRGKRPPDALMGTFALDPTTTAMPASGTSSAQGSVLPPNCVRKRPGGAVNDIVDHVSDEGEVSADRPGQPAVAGKKHEGSDPLPIPPYGGSRKRHQKNAGIVARQVRFDIEHLSPQEMLEPASQCAEAPGSGRYKSTMTIHPHLFVSRRTITPRTSNRHLGGSGDNLQARREALAPVATAPPAQQHRSGLDSHQDNTRTIIVKKDLLQRWYWEFPDSLRLREGGYLACVAGSCAIGFAASHEDIREHYQSLHPEMPPEKYDSTLQFYPASVIRQYEMIHGLGSAGVPSLYCTIKNCKDNGPYHAMKQLREHCYSSHGIQMRSPLRRKMVKGNMAWTHFNGTFAVVFDQHDRGGLFWIMNSSPAQRCKNRSLSSEDMNRPRQILYLDDHNIPHH
ncbi:hypothetical protein LTS03_011495 [Exophiala xenobiotica]|nr:hypothetical protein LTR40_002339 [Exophiala xenobiotica]KAK5344743.1 hypothetical protein LTR61_011489 [Exophiala xenobiotica]KAK5357285.1 hypothetical protein LTR11_011496 [Exophiala xenobiotica]KAK5357677.1 hypothetical protein LTS03_011495 [Exophiala xenobiotica]